MFFNKQLFQFSLIYICLSSLFVCSTDAIKPEEYLLQYGYVTTIPRTKTALTEAIRLYQTLFRLPVTGEFDEKTREMMARPRCGNKDPVDKVKARIIDPFGRDDYGRGYNLEGSKWTNYKMTYRMKEPDYGDDNYWSDKLDSASTLRLIRFAYDVWSAVTPLQFTYTDEPNRKVHAAFQFSVWVHCCHSNPPWTEKFDRDGDIMAHAFYPQKGGDVHIDDDESYLSDTNATRRDAKLKMILVHEIGHTLGLEHVWDGNSVMYPTYKAVEDDSYLSAGDIAGIRALYGNESLKLEGNMKLV